ncbi:hypothetical protein O181_009207 [Austropuccinia psidii MF-1]|uniref:Uncharacterized protein n=1 Tax=Austropuccinia psidii MF-1 TaxID=1389203 RepID=A0A9Q3BQC9_9BASI|nr:hypothetical protein [Austropuccinia psidii MF-1]
MEDARTSTSSQRLSSTFKPLFNSPEADITAIPVIRSEQTPTSSSRNIPVSVQELVYGSKHAGALETRKDRGPSEGFGSNVLQRESPTAKSLVEKNIEYCHRRRRGSWPKRRTIARWNLLKPPQVPKKDKQIPKEKLERQLKGKSLIEQALPSELQNYKEKQDSHGKCVQYGKSFD